MGNFNIGGGISIPLNSDFKKNFTVNLNAGYQKDQHQFGIQGGFTPFDKSWNIGGQYTYYKPLSRDEGVGFMPSFNIGAYGKNIQQVQFNPTISYKKDNITHSITPGFLYYNKKYFINPGYNVNINSN